VGVRPASQSLGISTLWSGQGGASAKSAPTTSSSSTGCPAPTVIAIFWTGQKWAKEQDGPRKRVWQDYRSDPVRVFEDSKAV
jgi:hypothetical protein